MQNYQGSKGIWVDIFPIDNTKKQKSIFSKVQSFYINQIKREMFLRLKYKKNGKVIKRIDQEEIIKSVIRFILCWWIYISRGSNLIKLQQKIMNLNKNNESEFLINFGSRYGIKKQTMPRNIYLPTIDMEFEGRLYKIPNNYKYFLKRIYGDNYMDLPPIDKRITHNPKKIVFEDGEEINFDE